MTPQEAYRKATSSGKRLPELEDIILTSPLFSCCYARDIIKGRWTELEDIIMTSSWSSYLYALNVVEGRWIEAEDIIMTDSYTAYYYALNVIKGKLPDKMHNMMILYAIKDLDIYVEAYFEYTSK